MNEEMSKFLYGRKAYYALLSILFLVLALSPLPSTALCWFLAVIAFVVAVTELLSRFVSRRLSEMEIGSSIPTEDSIMAIPAMALLKGFDLTADALSGPEFHQTEVWFGNTAIGSFA